MKRHEKNGNTGLKRWKFVLVFIAALMLTGILQTGTMASGDQEGSSTGGEQASRRIVFIEENGQTQILTGEISEAEPDGAAGASFFTDHSGIMGIALLAGQGEETLALQAVSGTDDYITGLSVTPPLVENYGKVRIEVSFSDGSTNEHVFHAGDTISVSWPTVGDASLTGYQATIPLVNAEGITYGTVKVTASGALLVFNEAVESLYDVHGSFYFEALAVNSSLSEDENTQTLQVIAGDKSAEVAIHKRQSASGDQGDTPDFRKVADDIGGGYTWIDGVGWAMSLDPADPTYVQWNLTANENLHEIASDILVSDRIGPGQQLDTDFLILYCNGRYQKSYSGTVESVIAAWQADYPGCSLTFDESGSLEWKISQAAADETYWCLIYRCNITDFELAYFENSADIIWQKPNGEEFSAHDEARFYNVEQGGDVHVLPRGVLQVTKAVEGTELKVAGITFTVEKHTDDGWVLQGTMTTDASGKATMTKLTNGSYRLYETEVPPYLVPKYTEEAPYEFVIDGITQESQSLALEVENPVTTVQIRAEKKWKNADGTEDLSAHPTIWLQLFRQSDAQSAPVAVGDSAELPDGTAEAVWGELPEYDVFGNLYSYFVKEVDGDGNEWTPEGYEKEESGLTVINRKKSFDMTLKKTDPNGISLAGAVFELYVKENGVFVLQGEEIPVVSESGVTVPGLEEGKQYRLEEKQAPGGFVLTEKDFYFSVEQNGRICLTDADGNPAEYDLAAVSGDGLLLTVTNLPGAELPETGGPGRNAYTPLALLLLAAALCGVLRKLSDP